MTLRLIHWLASKLQRRDIPNEYGDIYLERYRILGWMPGAKTRLPIGVYLHRIRLADSDPALHSHPWKWALSFVLSGRYNEERRLADDRVVTRRVRWLNWLRGESFHRIDSLDGEVWTLFITGPKAGSWGFRVNGETVPWRERLKQRGIQPEF